MQEKGLIVAGVIIACLCFQKGRHFLGWLLHLVALLLFLYALYGWIVAARPVSSETFGEMLVTSLIIAGIGWLLRGKTTSGSHMTDWQPPSPPCPNCNGGGWEKCWHYPRDDRMCPLCTPGSGGFRRCSRCH